MSDLGEVGMDGGEFGETLREIAMTRMPFGRYGPKEMNGDGAPLCDLPDEYLEWFQRRGFPGGRLGELMEIVFHLKKDGSDEVFNRWRAKRGGRYSLRPERPREIEIGDPELPL
ncbi:MAG: DUF3820 family protein [Planctomycetota bacterium]